MPGGRPSDYTQQIADEICEHIVGGKSLRSYCEKKGKPSVVTVMAWLRKHDEFLKQYALARECQADYWSDEIVHISDDGSNDTYRLDDGSEKVAHDHIQRSRLRVDTRKWLMARQAPKKYGEFQRTELTGADGGAVKFHVSVEIAPPPKDE